MIYILDLDHTLLDTTAFKKALEESLVPLGISPEQFQETYAATTSGIAGKYDYTIERHAAQLHERCGVDEQAARERLSGALDRLPDFLFADSLPFLELLNEKSETCVLLTLGNSVFQEEKVRRLGIGKYFFNMIFTEEKKDTVTLDLPEGPAAWVFINDNPIEIRGLQTRFPEARMIRIKRPGGKSFSARFRPATTFSARQCWNKQDERC